MNGFDISTYGFIKASSIYSTHALGSFNNINLSAPTFVPAQTRSQDKSARLSFQTQQSRVGFNFEKMKDLKAKLEFDFIDFNKSSPTVQMNPRVRIASMTYRWDNHTVLIGQDWDLFSPVTTFTFDIVGLYFMAGNTGFMRQQIQYLRQEGDWEFAAALGMAGNNPTGTDSDLELDRSPSYAARATKILRSGRIGLSGIYSRLTYETSNGVTQDVYGINGFYEHLTGPFSLKSEIYYGKNLGNIGTLALGKGTNTAHVKEFGGTLTAQFQISEKNFLFGGGGMAKIDNKSELSSFVMPATNIITQTGLRQNMIIRIGFDRRITPDFSWISEISRFQSESKLADNKYHAETAESFESGIQLRF